MAFVHKPTVYGELGHHLGQLVPSMLDRASQGYHLLKGNAYLRLCDG